MRSPSRGTRNTLALLLAASSLSILTSPAQAAPTCFGREATIIGEGYIEGTSADDVIVSTSEAAEVDRINGRGGDDRICSGEGKDFVRGAGGNDRIKLGPRNNDEALGGKGNDRIFGEVGVDLIEGGAGDDRIFGGGGDDQIESNRGLDVVRGEDGDDTILGGRGNDIFDGGPGRDALYFAKQWEDYDYDAGRVTVDLEAGTATAPDGEDQVAGFEFLSGTEGNDTLLGSDLPERVHGLGGADTIRTRGGDDVLVGDLDSDDPSDDILDGGDGVDTLDQGYSFEAVIVDLAQGTSRGASGSDTLTAIENVIGTERADTIRGDDGPNLLDGTGGDDVIEGRAGDDVLLGGLGADQIDGGEGLDTADGGEGTDSCQNAETVTACEGP